MTQSEYTDFTPEQMLKAAWNMISNARTDLPQPLYNRTTIILQELDAVLVRVQNNPPTPVEPLPIPLPDYYRDDYRGP